MSITVVCPNGHSLKVKDDCAGKAGLCPVCKARVEVPRPSNDGLSDDDILDILGPHDPGRSADLPYTDSGGGRRGSGVAEGERTSPPKKCCEKCNAEIPASTHVCPNCHTYIAHLNNL
jgi:ribosomal protein L40E